jgi:hypothetical protein
VGIYIENVRYDYTGGSPLDELFFDRTERELQNVVIKFTYCGDILKDFKGQIELSGKEYKASGNGKDLDRLVESVLGSELQHMVNRDDDEAWGKEIAKVPIFDVK